MDYGKRFTSQIIEKLNGKSGLYAITDRDNEILYIGFSSCLKTRVLTHALNKEIGDDFYNEAKRIYILGGDEIDEYDFKVQEMALINFYNPALNKINFSFKPWYYSLPLKPKHSYEDYMKFAKEFTKSFDKLIIVDLVDSEVIHEC